MVAMYCPYGGGLCEHAAMDRCGKGFPNLIACSDYWHKFNNPLLKISVDEDGKATIVPMSDNQ